MTRCRMDGVSLEMVYDAARWPLGFGVTQLQLVSGFFGIAILRRAKNNAAITIRDDAVVEL